MRHFRTIKCQEQTCGVGFTTNTNSKYCPQCRVERMKDQGLDSSLKRKNYALGVIRIRKPEEDKDTWLHKAIRNKRFRDF